MPDNPNTPDNEQHDSGENFYGTGPPDPSLRSRRPSPEELKVESPVYRDPEVAASAAPRARKARPGKVDIHRATRPYEPPVYTTIGPRNGEYRFSFLDIVAAFFFAVFGFGAVALTYAGFGHSWDEALYLKPSLQAMEWVTQLATGNRDMLRADQIDEHWGKDLSSDDPLHPEIAPIPKLVIGAGARFLDKALVDPVIAMRVPVAAAFGLSVALMYLIGAIAYGRLGGVAAAAFYLLTPRVFGHAHIAASETLLAFAILLTVWTFLGTMRFWVVALFTGIAWGLAIDTKVTALLLPVPFIIWAQIYHRRKVGSAVLAMMLVTPVVAVALWPWLWNGGALRFLQYLGFYLGHQSTATFYMGQMWGYTHGPAAPWHYPFVISAITLPEWLLLFLAIGLVRMLVQVKSRPPAVLFTMLALLFMGLAALPSSPKYDGERLFFPAIAFLVLLAAGGFSVLFAVPRARQVTQQSRAYRNWMGGLLLLPILAYGTADIVMTHPNELNYFNWVIGRSKGAYEKGFETSYWGEGLNNEVLDELNKTVGTGESIRPLALNGLVLQNLQTWEKLRKDIKITDDERPNWYLLQVRQGMMGRLERRLHEIARPTKSFEVGGVARIQLFRNAAGTTPTLAGSMGDPEKARLDADTESTTPTAVTPANDASSTTTVVAPAGTSPSAAVQPTPTPTPVPIRTPAPARSPSPSNANEIIMDVQPRSPRR